MPGPERTYNDDIPLTGSHKLKGGNGESFTNNFAMSEESFNSGLTLADVRGLKDITGKNFDPDTHPIWMHYKDIPDSAGLSDDEKMQAFSMALSMANNRGTKLDGNISVADFKAAYNDIAPIVARANALLKDNEAYWHEAEQQAAVNVAKADSTKDPVLPVLKAAPSVGGDIERKKKENQQEYEAELKKYLDAVMEQQLEQSNGKVLSHDELMKLMGERLKGAVNVPGALLTSLDTEYQAHVKTYQSAHGGAVAQANVVHQAPSDTHKAKDNHSASASHAPAGPGSPHTLSAEAKKFSEICKERIGTAALKDAWAEAADIRKEFGNFKAFQEAVAADTKCEAAKARAFEAYHEVMKGYTKGIKAEVEVNGTKMKSAALAGAVGIGNLNKAMDADKANDPKPISGLKEVMERAGVKMESGKEATISYTPTTGDGKAKTATLRDL